MDEEKSFLIVEFVNDNDLSNVKTLQSIFTQDCPVYDLVVCNDCTDAFQCERFLYNVTDHMPSNLRQIQVIENPHPRGETASLRAILAKYETDYTVVLHSGEILTGGDVLRRAAAEFDPDEAISALAVQAEQWDEDMKECERTLAWSDEAERNGLRDLRDCQFVYRSGALRRALQAADAEKSRVLEAVVPTLAAAGAVSARDWALCRFSERSVTSEAVELPEELGSERLRHIAQLLEEGADEKSAQTPLPPKRTTQANDPVRKRKLWLYKHSRFQRLKSAMAVTLMLILLGLFLLSQKAAFPLLSMLGVPALVVAALMALWIFAMLCCNLYYRKHPERLVFNDA